MEKTKVVSKPNPLKSSTTYTEVVSRPEQCEITESHYTAFDGLDWSDMMIRELADRIERLANVIDPVMEISGPECEEDSRPRVTNTTLIARITAQGEVLENLNRRVENMIGRVRL